MSTGYSEAPSNDLRCTSRFAVTILLMLGYPSAYLSALGSCGDHVAPSLVLCTSRSCPHPRRYRSRRVQGSEDGPTYLRWYDGLPWSRPSDFSYFILFPFGVDEAPAMLGLPDPA